MHLLVAVAIVTLNVAIISNAAIPSSSSDLNVNGEKRNVSFSIADEIVDAPTKKKEEMADATSDAKNREALELVMDRARKFSARLFNRWRQCDSSSVVFPLMQFLDIATDPHQRRLRGTSLMKILGFENDDPRMVELGLQILTDNLNDYMTVESSEHHRTVFTCTPSIRLKDMIQISLSNFLCLPFNPLSNRRWDISFDAVQSSKYDDFKTYSLFSMQQAKYMSINDVRCRYGEFAGSTFVELTSDKNHSENGTSLFIIRSENKEGYRRLNNELGAINFQELRATSSERIVDIYLPKLSLERTLKPWMWHHDNFSHECKPPNNKYDKDYFVRVGRNKHAGGISTTSDEDQAIINETGTTQSSEREEKFRFEVNRPFVIILARTGAVNLNLLTISFEYYYENVDFSSYAIFFVPQNNFE